jgi:hypothetical protein
MITMRRKQNALGTSVFRNATAGAGISKDNAL